MSKPLFEMVEDRIIQREAVDLVLSALSGYDFIITILWLDGWSIKDIAQHLEWDRRRVYARWQKIKGKGRKILIANGFTYAGNNVQSDIKLDRGEGRSLPSSITDDRPTPFVFGGNDERD